MELEAFSRGQCCLDLPPVRNVFTFLPNPGLPGKYVLSLCALCLRPSHPYSALCPRFLSVHVLMCTRMPLMSGRGSAVIAGPPHNRHPHCLCPVSLHLSLPGFSFGLPQRGDGTHWEGLLGACGFSVISPTTGLHVVVYTMAREREAELLY